MPIFGASPYLAGLALRRPSALAGMLAGEPAVVLEGILAEAGAGAVETALRVAKRDIHLLTALCDLGGVWDLDQVTAALTRFADRAVTLHWARWPGASARPAGSLGGSARRRPHPGLLRHRHGQVRARSSSTTPATSTSRSSTSRMRSVSQTASSPRLSPTAPPERSPSCCRRAPPRVMSSASTCACGPIPRSPRRPRPSPRRSTTTRASARTGSGRRSSRRGPPPATSPAARAFLAELAPFIWRRNLDFAAIADIHSIKRQIHAEKVDERLAARGADLKLGHGGIREIEFFVQTQQLILGGRDPSLRSSRTLDALAALAEAGHVSSRAAAELADAYRALRALEHRAQMVADEQTHRLPEDAAGRGRIAALSGAADLAPLRRRGRPPARRVNARYGELFAESEDLSSRFGSLVFTGVEDDPETLRTLTRMGFSRPGEDRIDHSRLAPRPYRGDAHRAGRELFTRLAPRLLEAAHATGAPDIAFARFADFFERLTAGVQVQSLFLAQPKLFQLVVEVMAFAPVLASVLARRPAALDAMLDRGFFAPLDQTEDAKLFASAIAETDGRFEAAMDAVRRAHRDQSFRIGVQVLSGSASAAEAGRAFADLADASIRALAPAALAEVERTSRRLPRRRQPSSRSASAARAR